MDLAARIESSIEAALLAAAQTDCPPRLADALHYAVFPGGARIRPRLTLAVALACGDDDPAASDAAATAIEILHCASLIHDDLPCFDDADMRRGKPSVHRAFGESLAVLAGDALIVLGFDLIAASPMRHPERMAPLIRVVGRAVGAQGGITAGQAWECESAVDLAAYHLAKTGSLFAAATVAGAAAAGAEHELWRPLGETIGEAFQVADDIADHVGSTAVIGKPTGRDKALGRPSAVLELGLDAAVSRLKSLVGRATALVPPCRGEAHLRALILTETQRFVPAGLVAAAA
ncbi:polyprenyl synthetase family protein [Methylopila turkensis]|uniref:Probable farnesyl diphosphate synthase n=1 Tax=Methylopila turkensis TaxID=1437816 RepID=A0A9W6JII0_9HYPH|nr:polyprenyl synthetase family protein [Methylopila turkensis]GLK78271.1 geranylgeranyl pyrophosphate synthase [Methylopila turkensis]